MKNRFTKLKEIESDLAPMFDYFNMVEDEKFLTVIEYLTKGWGFGLKSSYSCSFNGNGVKFINANGTQGNSLVLDYNEFYKYLEIACEDYLNENLDDKPAINSYLSRFKESYL